jgi:hypothetical protein
VRPWMALHTSEIKPSHDRSEWRKPAVTKSFRVLRKGRWPSGDDKPAATLAISVGEMRDHISAAFQSGKDDLGPFQQLGLRLASGRLVLLQHYDQSPSENLDVYVDREDNVAQALEELRSSLRLPPEKLEWIAPESA